MYNNLMDSIGFLADTDLEVSSAMKKELDRQKKKS